MEFLHKILDNFKDVATAAAIATGMVALLWLYIPPVRLVWRCLSVEENFPLLSTLKACLACAWPFKPAIFRNQMRLWLELRLLRPKPVKEPGWPYDPITKRYQLKFNVEAYKDKLDQWERDIQGKFAALKIREKEPLIEVRDVFRLNDEVTKNGIKQYLLAVAELKLSLDEQASFLCKVKINEGFLLPLNLLAGLMSRFSDDWDPIISSYGQMASKSFSPAQISLFDLWLLWGPSVPICTCDQWSGPLTLQYGFGDENNSVRVRAQGPAKEALLSELRKSAERRASSAYPALHASIVGKLWPPSSFTKGEFCAAQQELQNPDRETFILEYESHTVSGNASGSHLFYTAYVWAMFVVGRASKPTLDEVRNRPWLQVVPFFEHANIVDEITYEMAKLQLAHKVLTYVKNSAQFESDPSRAPLCLWYVCALDDSGCGKPLEVPPRGVTIRTAIERLLKEGEYKGIRNRVVMDDSSFAEVLSGCHLSEFVDEFFEAIGMQTPQNRPEPK
jgi:hypothetical protein